MPGREDFTTPKTGGTQRVVTVDRPELKQVQNDQITNVAAGGSEKTQIYAPVGAIYEVASMHLQASSIGTATSGSHSMGVRPMDVMGTMFGKSPYNTNVIFNNSHWQSATSTDMPPTAAAAYEAMRGLSATENAPVVVTYLNNTDASQTSNRTVNFIMRERSY